MSAAAAGCSQEPEDQGPVLPGITTTEVRIGFTVLQELSMSLLYQPTDGGAEMHRHQIRALVDSINEGGGMGGRTVVPVIRTYEPEQDRPDQARKHCEAFAADGVFAVVGVGITQPSALPCYSGARMVLVDQTLTPRDRAMLTEHAPYLWTPSQPEYQAFLKAQIEAMRADGFFDGVEVAQVIAPDGELGRRAVADVAEPALTELGIESVVTSYVDRIRGWPAGFMSEELEEGEAAGATRVLVVGGDLLPIALSTIEAGKYDARWSVSTFDAPAFLADNPQTLQVERMRGQSGLGFAPILDGVGGVGQSPDPADPAQVRCLNLLRDAEALLDLDDTPNLYATALRYCDGAFFLDAALDRLDGAENGVVTESAFRSAGLAANGAFDSALAMSGEPRDGDYAAAVVSRPLRWIAGPGLSSHSEGRFVYGDARIPVGGEAAGS